MEHKNKLFAFLFLTVILLLPAIPMASAAWATNGNPVCTDPSNSVSPKACDALNGNVITAWQDMRNDVGDIYAQKINSTGHVQWTTNGVPVSVETSYQTGTRVCSDGTGGAFIVWYDARNGGVSFYDIYAQRVNETGDPQWTSNGIPICTADDQQVYPEMVASDSGSAIIIWQDERVSSSGDIYAQKVNATGGLEWGANGTAICTTTEQQGTPELCSDGAGGAIIVWVDARGPGVFDIYGQHINSAGVPQWTTNGIPIVNASQKEWIPKICSDGAGGAVVAWWDERERISTEFHDIYAQRVTAAGQLLWGANGTVIANGTSLYQPEHNLIPDGTGGAIIVWEFNVGMWDVYGQRINGAGTKLWGANGKVISGNSNHFELDPRLCSDGAGGAIVAWEDARHGSKDIYAQRIDSNGNPLWCATGVALTTATGWEDEIQLVNVSTGNAIAVWVDQRNSSVDIYADYVTAWQCPEDNPIPGFALLYMCLGILILGVIYREKLKIKK